MGLITTTIWSKNADPGGTTVRIRSLVGGTMPGGGCPTLLSKKSKFTVILEPEAEGGFHVTCPILPGCRSAGETMEEAIVNIREAIELYVESLVEHGEPVPVEPSLVITTTEVDLDVRHAVSAA